MIGPQVLVDARWRGAHGIGRFAAEIVPRICPRATLDGKRRPATVLDPLRISIGVRAAGATTFYTPGYNVGLRGAYRQVVTLHDLIHLEVDDERSVLKQTYYDRLVRPAVRDSGVVMTVSEFSRSRISAWSGLAPERVVNVGAGCSLRRATAEEIAARATAGSHGLVLYVGNEKPHKNLPLLLAALASMPRDVNVTTVGVSPGRVASLASLAGVDPTRVRAHGRVSDATLRELYLSADCLAMPSVYEGLGLPPLEAMAVGTPSAYVAEAVGESVGPLGFRARSEPEAFAEAIAQAMEHGPTLRAALVERSQEFSWDDVAHRVMAVLEAAE